MKPGDKVRFKGSVIAHSGHSQDVANMRGTVLMVRFGIAQIDCHGTYNSEDGILFRWIPVTNLCTWSDILGIYVDNQ